MEKVFVDDSYVSFVLPTTEKSTLSHLSVCLLWLCVVRDSEWSLFSCVTFWGDTSAHAYDLSKESLADRNF